MSADEAQGRIEARMAEILPNRLSHEDYLLQIERLARAVETAAFDERGPSIWRPEEATTPLQAAIAELGLALRTVHFEGDGCV